MYHGLTRYQNSLSDQTEIVNDVVLTRDLTTTMRGGQFINSSVLDEPVTDHTIP